MKYCALIYDITYKDGSKFYGEVPYRGEFLAVENLVRFVKGYLAGSKTYDGKDLAVKIEKVYDDPKEWLTVVMRWASFTYLRGVINFAGDLILKYFPNEVSLQVDRFLISDS
jgi:hypothetical protein